jgi:hypothetical protein
LGHVGTYSKDKAEKSVVRREFRGMSTIQWWISLRTQQKTPDGLTPGWKKRLKSSLVAGFIWILLHLHNPVNGEISNHSHEKQIGGRTNRRHQLKSKLKKVGDCVEKRIHD